MRNNKGRRECSVKKLVQYTIIAFIAINVVFGGVLQATTVTDENESVEEKGTPRDELDITTGVSVIWTEPVEEEEKTHSESEEVDPVIVSSTVVPVVTNEVQDDPHAKAEGEQANEPVEPHAENEGEQANEPVNLHAKAEGEQANKLVEPHAEAEGEQANEPVDSHAEAEGEQANELVEPHVEVEVDAAKEESKVAEKLKLESITKSSNTTERVNAIMEYLMKNGFSSEAAAGVVGNIAVEACFNPTKISDSGYYGIFQWNTCAGGEFWWYDIADWLDANGFAWDSFEGQVRAFVECDNKGMMSVERFEELKKIKNVEQATELVAVFYEGCIGGETETVYYNEGTPYQGLETRKSEAWVAYFMYQNGTQYNGNRSYN